MFKVMRLTDDEFILIAGKRAIYGNMPKMCVVMAELGVEWEEIEEGLTSLVSNQHQVASYGLNRTFIYSRPIQDR
jgi:hypothetical protein